MPQDVDQPTNGININRVMGNVNIDGDVVGRDKIVSIENVTIQQFVDGTVPLETQVEFFLKHIGLEGNQARYAISQYEAYCGVWRSLQALRLTGDDLWDKPDNENIARFSAELRNAQLVVRQGEIFFEDEDRTELLRLLDSLGRFRLGKIRLIEIRSKEEAEEYQVAQFAPDQIQANRRYKEEYEQLLDKIRISFKQKLSGRPM